MMSRDGILSDLKEEISKSQPVMFCSLIYPLVIVWSWQERQEQEEELKAKEAELLRGNPLLNNQPTTFSVKRRFIIFKI